MAETPCPERLPAASASAFSALATALHILAEAVPTRTTIRQAECLMIIAYAHVMNRSITLTEVIATTEDNGGRALERSLHVFIAPNRAYPEALDWVEQVEDRDDRRKKYLRLTQKGIAALSEVLAAIAVIKEDCK